MNVLKMARLGLMILGLGLAGCAQRMPDATDQAITTSVSVAPAGAYDAAPRPRGGRYGVGQYVGRNAVPATVLDTGNAQAGDTDRITVQECRTQRGLRPTTLGECLDRAKPLVRLVLIRRLAAQAGCLPDNIMYGQYHANEIDPSYAPGSQDFFCQLPNGNYTMINLPADYDGLLGSDRDTTHNQLLKLVN